MNLFSMALRGVKNRGWVSTLTLLSLSLGVALPCTILRIREQVETSLLQEGQGIDLVVGAKGSPLQLVLSTVHHLDLPTGNIPWRMVEELRTDPRITATLPIGLGDNFRGYRILGTDDGIRNWHDSDDRPLATLQVGTWFKKAFEVVIGSEVALRTGLKIGDSFVGAHGLIAAPGTDHDDFPYVVTGILETNGSAVDRLILTPIASVWEMHAAEQNLHNRMFGSGKTAANTEPEITAVWLRLRSPGLRMWMREEINTETPAMAAAPIDEMLRLSKGILAPLQDGLLIMGAAVVTVSALGILSTLLQAARLRRRDWAMLRVLGAHPHEIFLLVWLEALWLTGGSLLLGLLFSHGGLALASTLSQRPLLQSLDPWKFAGGENWVLLGVLGFGLLSGLLPAWAAYRRSPLKEITSS